MAACNLNYREECAGNWNVHHPTVVGGIKVVAAVEAYHWSVALSHPSGIPKGTTEVDYHIDVVGHPFVELDVAARLGLVYQRKASYRMRSNNHGLAAVSVPVSDTGSVNVGGSCSNRSAKNSGTWILVLELIGGSHLWVAA